jgi:hypothetical protein
MTEAFLVFVFFAACGGVLWFGRIYAERSPRGREAVRRLYRDPGMLHFIRNAIPVAPLLGTGLIVLGLCAIFPRTVSAWLLVVAIVLGGGGLLLSYRTPPPLAPKWFREELADGRLNASRPGPLDWIIFWMFLPLTLLGPFAVAALILVFDAVQP